METGSIHIKNLEIPQLQALVSKYPWFSYAREVLLCRLVSVEPECLENSYKENLIFFPRREAVLMQCRSLAARCREEQNGVASMDVVKLLDVDAEVVTDEEFEIDFDLMQQEAEAFALEHPVTGEDDLLVEEEPKTLPPSKPKFFVVGGDYFSKADFDELSQEEKAPEIKFGAPADNVDRMDIPAGGDPEVDFESMDFVTETLAAIYADQGYYDKAIDAYAKLILLYPEKSTYFASLVNEIKSKN